MARTRSIGAIVIGVALVALIGACADDGGDEWGPVPPERFTAAMIGDYPEAYAVALTWEPTGPRNSFALEVSGDGGPWFEVGTAGRDVRRAVVWFPPDLPDATRLTFRIRSQLETQVSGWTETSVSFAVRPVSWVRVEPNGPALKVSWFPRALVADSVRLERRLVAHGGEVTPLSPVELSAATTSYVDDDVAAWADGGRIRYGVVYVRREVESAPVHFDSPPAAPRAPDGLIAAADDRTVRLTWTNRSVSATRIEIQKTVFPGNWSTTYPPFATLAADAVSFEDTQDEYGLTQYRVAAVSGAGRGEATVSAVAAPPELLQAFEARIVELPDASNAAGDPDVGWLLARPTVGLLPVGGRWEERTFAFSQDGPSLAMGPAGGVLAGAGAASVSISTRGPDGWTDSAIPSDAQVGVIGAAVAASGAAIAWHEWATDALGNVTGVFRYADQAAAWVPEVVSCGSFVDVDPRTLRLAPDGDPAMLDPEYRRLVRRSAGSWACEPIPAVDPARLWRPGNPLAFAPSSAGGALVVSEFPDYDPALRGLYAVERDASGWLAPVQIVSGDFGSADVFVEVADDGRAIVLLNEPTSTATRGLLLRGVDGSWTRVPLLPRSLAIAGFDSAGKAWVLDGLAAQYQTRYAEGRPYALFVER